MLYNEQLNFDLLREAHNAIENTNANKAVNNNTIEGKAKDNIIEEDDYEFNPYESKFISQTGYKEFGLNEYRVDSIQEEIEREKEKREKAARTPVTDREIIIYKTGDIEPSSILH